MGSSRTVMIADCDHASVDIERETLKLICREVPWQSCRTEEDVIRICSTAEGLLVQYSPLTARVLRELKRCRGIVRYGVGVDTIDLKAASDLGIVVSNVPDYGTEEVSDHALALILNLARKIYRADGLVKSGVWDFARMKPVPRLGELTLGIVGFGRIGSSLARKADSLGMRIVACDPYMPPAAIPGYVSILKLDELLARADVVSVHCPLNAETRNLLSAERIARMKPGAYLVNTARGGIVDEDALAEALRGGRLAGVALDVLAVEPIRPDHPLLGHPDFLCTPHMAWHSSSAERDLKRKAAEEIARIVTGQTPKYQVNRRAS